MQVQNDKKCQVDAIQIGRGSVEAWVDCYHHTLLVFQLEDWEAKMERMLTWMLAPAVHGIPVIAGLFVVPTTTATTTTTTTTKRPKKMKGQFDSFSILV